MEKYIKASELMDIITKRIKEANSDSTAQRQQVMGWNAAIGMVANCIEEMQGEDVCEMRRGEWLKEDRGGVEYTAVCSECKEATFWSERTPFCHECGAQMSNWED